MTANANTGVVPPDAARLIQDVLATLGWPADAADVAEQVRRLNIGLPAEDEFAVICAWLGKCQLLHKLDQQQVPVSSREVFQIPDLLAKFSTQSRHTPVLIEVKSKKEKVLSFTPDYMEKLQNYASLMGMPLLIAWKFHGWWTLFEAKHMKKAKKNFNISHRDAARENLLGVLVGDVAYQVGAGAGVHIRFRKNQLMGTEPAPDGHVEQWMMTIDDVTFTDYSGLRRKDLDEEVQSLMTTWEMENREEHTESHVHLSFVAGDGNGIQFAHSALIHLLNWESPQEDVPHWRGLLRKEKVTANIDNFSAALRTAYQQKVVSLVIYQHPHSTPDFLPRLEVASSEEASNQ